MGECSIRSKKFPSPTKSCNSGCIGGKRSFTQNPQSNGVLKNKLKNCNCRTIQNTDRKRVDNRWQLWFCFYDVPSQANKFQNLNPFVNRNRLTLCKINIYDTKQNENNKNFIDFHFFLFCLNKPKE